MRYHHDPDGAFELWGQKASSTLLQPPLFGHAVVELERNGFADDELRAKALSATTAVVRQREQNGLLEIVHPWESGMDDSPRWDAFCPGGYDGRRWYDAKGRFVSGGFRVPSVGFTALTAFGLAELGTELSFDFDECWDDQSGQWVDPTPSGAVRTLDGLLPVLVEADPDRRARVFSQLVDPEAFGGVYGPAFVHRAEQTFEPATYWRGSVWPQLTYLFWAAAARAGVAAVAEELARQLVRGCVRSGYAEHWHADSGEGLGARPQSWAAIAAVVV